MTTSRVFKIGVTAALVLGLAACQRSGDKNADAPQSQPSTPKEEPMSGMSSGEGMAHEDMPGMAAPASATHNATGKIEAIEGNSVSIAHEAVPSANWPAMTMSFQVADQGQLANLKAGELVDFTFAEQSQGQYVITKIEPSK